MRSAWKFPFANNYFYRDKFLERFKNGKNEVKVYKGSTFLSDQFLDNQIKVYNGKKFLTIPIYNPEIKWKYIGEFYFTKKRGTLIHSKNKKSKKNYKKKK